MAIFNMTRPHGWRTWRDFGVRVVNATRRQAVGGNVRRMLSPEPASG